MSKTFVPGDVVQRVEFVKAFGWVERCREAGTNRAVVESVHGDKLKLQGSTRMWTAAYFDLVPGLRARNVSDQPNLQQVPKGYAVNPDQKHDPLTDYTSAIEAAELRAAKSAAHAAAEAERVESLRQQQAEVEAAAAAEAARIAALDDDLALLEATRHLLQGIKLDSLTLPKQVVPFRKALQPLANKHGYKLVLIGDGTTVALCKLNVKA